MPRVDCVKRCAIQQTPRVVQLQGLFDVPPAPQSESAWSFDVPFDEKPWSVGLIVGPSGSGKSSVARHLWPEQIDQKFDWPADRCVVDSFPPEMGIKDITGLLSSVGFSSPPAWLRPFQHLSTGQQFRVSVARALAQGGDPIVIDEFTSVVDRQVAQVGSAAIAKAVRRSNQRFVAVTCHYDVIDWLCPDWVLQPHTGEFQWRCERRRPAIPIAITRGTIADWPAFRGHHYLSGSCSRSARVFVAFATIGNKSCLCGFMAITPVVGAAFRRRFRGEMCRMYRGHRIVVLPDFQGVGIGNAMIEAVAEQLWQRERIIYQETTSAPSIAAHRRKQTTKWACMATGDTTSGDGGKLQVGTTQRAWNRMPSRWRYIPEEFRKQAAPVGEPAA